MGNRVNHLEIRTWVYKTGWQSIYFLTVVNDETCYPLFHLAEQTADLSYKAKEIIIIIILIIAFSV